MNDGDNIILSVQPLNSNENDITLNALINYGIQTKWSNIYKNNF